MFLMPHWGYSGRDRVWKAGSGGPGLQLTAFSRESSEVNQQQLPRGKHVSPLSCTGECCAGQLLLYSHLRNKQGRRAGAPQGRGEGQGLHRAHLSHHTHTVPVHQDKHAPPECWLTGSLASAQTPACPVSAVTSLIIGQIRSLQH